MGELNIDANLVASAGVLQREEQLVRLENGCICCTLRVDLLEQIARIAQQGEVDYIVIESSGISEPMQVAETFVFELPEGAEEQAMQVAKVDPALSPSSSKRSRTESGASSGDDTSVSSPSASTGIPTVQLEELLVRDGEKLPLLRDIALLDTCVTVVDAATFFHVFDDPRMLADVEENRSQLPEGDSRTITDLLIDQIDKGVFWLGSRPFSYGTMSQAGLYCTLANGGMWIAALPEEERMEKLSCSTTRSSWRARQVR
ncbi:hypothetical protein KRP22_013443 [Phytophthora ramorum]|nr:putative metal chaperone YciC [Phytophthora ramorum]